MKSVIPANSKGVVTSFCGPIWFAGTLRVLPPGRIFSGNVASHFLYLPAFGERGEWLEAEAAQGGQSTNTQGFVLPFSSGATYLPWPGRVEWVATGTGTAELDWWKWEETAPEYQPSWHERARLITNAAPITIGEYAREVRAAQNRTAIDQDGTQYTIGPTPIAIFQTTTLQLLVGNPTILHERFWW